MKLKFPTRSLGLVFATALLAGCTAPAKSTLNIETNDLKRVAPTAYFDWFEYEGRDDVYETLTPDPEQYLNPILAGFYPDPSIVQVDDTYYLVNSTFSYFPGLPVFRSTDLVNWTQIGNAIDRPGMLDFTGLGLSRGVFAPTIEHHAGTFYIANTCVDCGGNFIITATNPAGPWSDPVWLLDVGGIDPSLFFDIDGKVYVMNNDEPPEAARYPGHRAIWLREVDPQTFQPVSDPIVLIDGGVRPEENPIWIEGPHIYKIGDWYYLSTAEGGTAVDHSQVILRAKTVTGPYVPNQNNPILTQRHLDSDRDNPITSVGHADFVQDAVGKWWITFLGVRPYESDFYNTGRETFLLPVRWEDGWPVILASDELVPYQAPRPNLPDGGAPDLPTAGNFRVLEDFSGDTLPLNWMMIRVIEEDWFQLEDGALNMQARPISIGAGLQPSFLGRRQQHLQASATTSLTFVPQKMGDEAGLSILQSDTHYYAMGVGLNSASERTISLRKRTGIDDPIHGQIVASRPLPGTPDVSIGLRIIANRDVYSFEYKITGTDWQLLTADQDGKMLSTRTAGGFVGAVFGVYAERAMPE